MFVLDGCAQPMYVHASGLPQQLQVARQLTAHEIPINGRQKAYDHSWKFEADSWPTRLAATLEGNEWTIYVGVSQHAQRCEKWHKIS